MIIPVLFFLAHLFCLSQCQPVFILDPAGNETEIRAQLLKRQNPNDIVEIKKIKYNKAHCSPNKISILQKTVMDVFNITEDMETGFARSSPHVQAFWPARSMADQWMAYG